MKKNILRWMIVLAVLVPCLLISVSAASGSVIDSGYCGGEGDGTNLTWTLYEDGELVIEGTGKMASYSWFDHEDVAWYELGEQITTVTIKNGVTTIGECSFYEHAKLTSISIPASVTTIEKSALNKCHRLSDLTIPDSVTNIESDAFRGCASLTSVTIPAGVTVICERVFYGCAELVEVSIPDGVTSIEYGAFYGCRKLAGLNIPNGVTSIDRDVLVGCSSLAYVEVGAENTAYCSVDGVLFDKTKSTLLRYPGGRKGAYEIPAGVTTIGEDAFGSCVGLTEVTIPDSVTSIKHSAFSSCTGLTEATVPGSVTEIGWSVFSGCTELINVTIEKGVTSIGDDMFIDCVNLVGINGTDKVVIPDGVTEIGGYAFCGCESLSKVELPDSVTYIGGDAFCGCAALTAINLPDGITGISDGVFEGCTSLTSIDIPDGVTYIGYGAFNGAGLVRVTIPDGVSRIETCAFYRCHQLTEAMLGTGVTEIGQAAFGECENLTSIQIPSKVTYIGWVAFSGCSSLKSVKLPSDLLEIDGYAFSGCEKLTELDIPDGVTVIRDGAFSGCAGLTEVTIPASVTEIGRGAFGECSALTAILVADGNPAYCSEDGVLYDAEKSTLIQCPGGKVGIFEIPVGVTEFSEYALSGCAGLTEVTIPVGVTQIENYVFASCVGLTRVTIPTGVTRIGYGAFSGCTNLADVKIPNGMVEIDGYAFGGCRRLDGIEIPVGVTRLGSGAFSDCVALSDVEIPASATDIGYGPFSGCTNLTEIKVATDNPNYCSVDGVLFDKAQSKLLQYPGGKAGSYVIPDGVTTIDYDATSGCAGLTKVTVPAGLTAMEDTFPDCANLTEIAVAPDNPNYCSVDGVLFDKVQSCLLRYPGGKAGAYVISDSVISVGYDAFAGCTQLTKVTVGNAVTDIAGDTFANCSNLTTVIMGEQVWGVQWLAFPGCTKLTRIEFLGNAPSASRDGKEYISKCTFYCHEGTAGWPSTGIWEGRPLIWLAEDGREIIAFGSCGGDESELNWNVYEDGELAVSGTGEMARWSDVADAPWYSVREEIKTVTIGNGVMRVGDASFAGCTSVTEIKVEAGNAEYCDIDGVLYTADKSVLVCYPAGKTRDAFTVPEETSAIAPFAFTSCGNLEKLYLPETVQTLGEVFVSNCDGLVVYAKEGSPAYAAAVAQGLNVQAVAEDIQQSIAVEASPQKSVFALGEECFDGLSVVGDDGQALELDKCELDYDPDATGVQEVTVTYQGVTTTFDILLYDEEEQTLVDFGTQTIREDETAFAAIYDENGRMISVQRTAVLDGTVQMVVDNEDYRQADRGKLLVLNKRSFAPVGNGTTKEEF